MSTENKYQFKGTPAPWFVCKHHAYDGEYVVFSNPDEMPEGINDYIDCNTPEDAHLCAAAPELLQACVEALERMEMNDRFPELQEQLKTAIHKALNIQD